jgi:hypothetical protein
VGPVAECVEEVVHVRPSAEVLLERREPGALRPPGSVTEVEQQVPEAVAGPAVVVDPVQEKADAGAACSRSLGRLRNDERLP